jgi:hypothetical protein
LGGARYQGGCLHRRLLGVLQDPLILAHDRISVHPPRPIGMSSKQTTTSKVLN